LLLPSPLLESGREGCVRISFGFESALSKPKEAFPSLGFPLLESALSKPEEMASFFLKARFQSRRKQEGGES
jgi:hypothetical protein